MHAGYKVLMEVDNNSALIAGHPERILGQQLRPQPIHLLNTINITYVFFIRLLN